MTIVGYLIVVAATWFALWFAHIYEPTMKEIRKLDSDEDVLIK